MSAQDPTESRGSNYQVRALERALDILDSFSLRTPELTLTEIAAAVDLPKSTTKRLLSALEDRGYLERSLDTDHYRIGIRAFEIGSIYIQTTTIEAEARPFLERLARECQQTANLGVLNRGEVVHIAVVAPDRPIRFYASVGEREKVYCSGLGKALISELDEQQLETLTTQHTFEQRTRRTITSLDVLRINLGQIREQGYALDDEESVSGLRCIAAPIRNDKAEIIAAVSISGPAFEFSEEVMPTYVEAVTRTAQDISERFGYAVHPVEVDATEVVEVGASDEGSGV